MLCWVSPWVGLVIPCHLVTGLLAATATIPSA